MQSDFHYYATYCAAVLAGYFHEEALEICYSANFVDLCTATFLQSIHAPIVAATTQLNMEMADTTTNLTGRQGITRIWSSFHFLPKDLYADPQKGSRRYKEKYRLICGPNGDLIVDTVNLAKGKSLQHIGIAMHVLADTWAHRGFAGTPSLVINNMSGDVVELIVILMATGVIGILRAFEQKGLGVKAWKWKFLSRLIYVLLAIACAVFIKSANVAVVIFAAALIYAALVRIITAVRPEKAIAIL